MSKTSRHDSGDGPFGYVQSDIDGIVKMVEVLATLIEISTTNSRGVDAVANDLLDKVKQADADIWSANSGLERHEMRPDSIAVLEALAHVREMTQTIYEGQRAGKPEGRIAPESVPYLREQLEKGNAEFPPRLRAAANELRKRMGIPPQQR